VYSESYDVHRVRCRTMSAPASLARHLRTAGELSNDKRDAALKTLSEFW
jgi:hypothetical protein